VVLDLNIAQKATIVLAAKIHVLYKVGTSISEERKEITRDFGQVRTCEGIIVGKLPAGAQKAG
jgi:hypothetical protein